MFTGIIRATGKVVDIESSNRSRLVVVSSPATWKSKAGDSIAVNGICSTIRKSNRRRFEVEYMPETLSKTSVRRWKKNETLNLELPLKFNDRLDGHFLEGHIDTVGQVMAAKNVGRSKVLKIKFPIQYRHLIVSKGSIAVDGVSLTVNEAKKGWFSVSLVSYTLKNSNLGGRVEGDLVNLEFDLIGKYLHSILSEKHAKKAK